jgi:hypothetical protein
MKKLDPSKETPMTGESPMYLFATETVSDYYNKIGLKGKKALTVCGSGDQVLGAWFAGASEVVCYDINANSEHMLHLKIATIKCSSYHEFLRFFGVTSGKKLDHDRYLKIREYINGSTRHFFDQAYESSDNDGLALSLSEEFFRQREGLTDPLRINDYLKNEKSYARMRDLVGASQFRFIRAGANELPGLNERFDVINLSNIPDYLALDIERDGVRDPLVELSNLLVRMTEVLMRNGVIFYYLHSLKLANLFTSSFQSIRPVTAKPHSIVRLREKYGINISTRRIKGVAKNSLDKIAIVRAEEPV